VDFVSLLRVASTRQVIAIVNGHSCHRVERVGPCSSPAHVASEKTLEAPLGLAFVTSHLPEARDGLREPQCELRLLLGLETIERSTHIVVLCLDSVQPLPIDSDMRLELPGDRQKPFRVLPGQPSGLTAGFQLLPSELTNRLEHPVALVRKAEEALLDERLQGVEVGFAHLLRGLERAAAGED
jgi:hypothetical protein